MEEFGSFGWAVQKMAAKYDEKALEEYKQVLKTHRCPHCGSYDIIGQGSSGMSENDPGMVEYHCNKCGKGARSLTFEPQ